MVSKEEYKKSLQEYCDHINSVKKMDNPQEVMKKINEYINELYLNVKNKE